MRKSVASYVRASGGDAQRGLGHFDPRMTEQVYIDLRIYPKPNAADIVPRMNELPPLEMAGK